MEKSKKRVACPDCETGSINRREFLTTVGGVALAAGALPVFAVPKAVLAAPAAKGAAETAVKALYKTLSESQRDAVCLPFDTAKRGRMSANWDITKPKFGSDFYSTEQRGLMKEIFRSVTSEDGYGRFMKQMEEDYGGFDQYTMAIFGEPGTGKFEWMMTGRHLTIRADGDSVDNAAFGGPIVYGHGAGGDKVGLPGNVFYYQLKKANEVFQALDPKQRDKALQAKAPGETEVFLQGEGGSFPGIAVGELASDQKELVEQTIKVLLAPYREQDVEEAVAMLKAGGGLEKLHLAFYKAGDDGKPNIGEDSEWEIWRLEGPTFVWHFRGQPHVHTYVNIGKKG